MRVVEIVSNHVQMVSCRWFRRLDSQIGKSAAIEGAQITSHQKYTYTSQQQSSVHDSIVDWWMWSNMKRSTSWQNATCCNELYATCSNELCKIYLKYSYFIRFGEKFRYATYLHYQSQYTFVETTQVINSIFNFNLKPIQCTSYSTFNQC